MLIVDERIQNIAPSISVSNANIIDAEGFYLIPGMIDDQVHFREPGLVHKADIHSNLKRQLQVELLPLWICLTQFQIHLRKYC